MAAAAAEMERGYQMLSTLKPVHTFTLGHLFEPEPTAEARVMEFGRPSTSDNVERGRENRPTDGPTDRPQTTKDMPPHYVTSRVQPTTNTNSHTFLLS